MQKFLLITNSITNLDKTKTLIFILYLPIIYRFTLGTFSTLITVTILYTDIYSNKIQVQS